MTSPAPPDQQPPDPPWGPGATIAWALMALLLGFLVAGVLDVMRTGEAARATADDFNGVTLTFQHLVAVPIYVGVVVFAVQLRRWPPAVYLGLVPPRRFELLFALALIVVLDVLFDGIFYAAGREIVPKFQVDTWRSSAEAGWLLWYLFAIVVAAPVGEEIVFRGFLFRGLAQPGWEVHAIGAIALAWALLHFQYDWVGTAVVFLLGLLLGWFRWASGSTVLTIGMHMLINALAMVETWIKMEYFS